MFKPVNPADAYRKVELDACIAGSSGRDLVLLCIGDVKAALAQVLWADRNQRQDIRRRAMARALTGLAALRLGVDPANNLGPALLTFYDSMARSVAACQLRFEREVILRVATDIDDVSAALSTQKG